MRVQMIECSDRVVLACSCGGRVVLIGRKTDWYREQHLEFTCECGRSLSLGDSLPED
jgi:hypothetical protein